MITTNFKFGRGHIEVKPFRTLGNTYGHFIRLTDRFLQFPSIQNYNILHDRYFRDQLQLRADRYRSYSRRSAILPDVPVISQRSSTKKGKQFKGKKYTDNKENPFMSGIKTFSKYKLQGKYPKPR